MTLTFPQAKKSLLNRFDPDLPKILVVDDHTVSRQTAVALLEVESYEVLQADSGPAALEQVMRSQPDLILLDVMMPGMDGFEVCRQLKQDEQTRLIPVIFITALSDQRSRIQGIEAGEMTFLPNLLTAWNWQPALNLGLTHCTKSPLYAVTKYGRFKLLINIG
jgi:putative two-component system response regulator